MTANSTTKRYRYLPSHGFALRLWLCQIALLLVHRIAVACEKLVLGETSRTPTLQSHIAYLCVQLLYDVAHTDSSGPLQVNRNHLCTSRYH